jgi:hypothetical protein
MNGFLKFKTLSRYNKKFLGITKELHSISFDLIVASVQ